MNRMYLIAFDGPSEIRERVTDFLDKHDQIIDWHSSMHNSVLVVTDLDAAALRDLFRSSPARRFLVAEIHPEKFNAGLSGWLPRASWDFIKRRQPAE